MQTTLRINGNKKIAHNNIRAKVGITDKKNQSVFYLEGCSFIMPTEDIDDFNETIQEVEKTCRKSLKKRLINHPDLNPEFLLNFEVCSDRMKIGKKSFLNFQCHFKQYNNESLVFLKERNEDFFVNILDDVNNCLNSYGIVLSKKKN